MEPPPPGLKLPLPSATRLVLLQSSVDIYTDELRAKSRIKRWRGDERDLHSPSALPAWTDKRRRPRKLEIDLLVVRMGIPLDVPRFPEPPVTAPGG